MMKIPKLPSRDPISHKSQNGRLAIIGGQNRGELVMIGGVSLAAMAAFRSGVGLCRIISEKDILPAMITIAPSATGYDIHSGTLGDYLMEHDALVFGVGLGVGDFQTNLLKTALKTNLPIIIDADGINILAQHPVLKELIHEQVVITPHPGEYSRLAATFNLEPRKVHGGNNIPAARQLAETLGCVVVLKGAETVVSDKNVFYENAAPNPVLGVGGSGDVLSGIIGSLMAQHFSSDEINFTELAIIGVKIHSQAAAEWSGKKRTKGMLPSDLIDLLPDVIQKF
jgi:hydroxyethylthiazole kinase-like uncharacterized protein yjeF